MELFSRAVEGFQSVSADTNLAEQALPRLRQWLTQPEFASYLPQLQWLIETGQWPGLIDRFYQILPFGTGGRRGAVGIGPNRMNLWTLAASVQGHCEYLKEEMPGLNSWHVVVAYDVRRFEDRRKQYNPDLPNPVLHLSSRDFAQHAVGVYVANGIRASILPADSTRYLATPELSFTIRYLRAHGGLNVSASHNPPDDNGGKFYDAHGGQPIPPEDQIMADLVDQVTTIQQLPWSEAVRSGGVHSLNAAPHEAYIDLCRRQSLIRPPRFDEVKIIFTPLHGVGSMTALETLVGQGFRVKTVAEQMTPDGQFPNVTQTPNPEIPASMDRAVALARQEDADLVLSTDPDADRLGAMVPRSPQCQEWRFLTGNEIAALLTHFKLAQLARHGRLPASPVVITTDVTTRLVTCIARHFGAQVVDNLLVGFKYIADVLQQLEKTGAYEDVRGRPEDFVIACEESHGLLVTHQIRDKDAAGGALLLAELALDQNRRNRSVLDYLHGIFCQFGYFRNEVMPLVMAGLEGKRNMARMLDRLRAAPLAEIGGLTVTGFEDLRDESGRFGPFKGATDKAARNVVGFRLGDRARITLRPSGTEPKAKAYIEVSSSPCPARASAEEWRQTCDEVDMLFRRVCEDFLSKALGLVGMKPT
jgi:phosphoglucomutase/phosphomannomutase